MNITLNFDNLNAGGDDGVRIYRADTPILEGSLPAPMATLASGATTYTDTTAVHGNMYHYRVSAYKGTDEQLARDFTIRALAPDETGPGPQALIAGDWELGYFGYCKSSELLSYSSLASALGITTGTANTDFGWVKVAYKGKILYIARNAARHNLTYNSIYAAGAVYGTNDDGAVVPTGATNINQYRLQTVNGYSFIPRILKGMPAGAALPANKAAADATQLASHEWDDIMSMFVNSGRSTTDTVYSQCGRFDEIFYPAMNNPFSIVDMTQQQASFSNAGLFVGRGVRVASATVVRLAPICQTAVNVSSFTSSLFNAGGTIYAAWRPVMELVV